MICVVVYCVHPQLVNELLRVRLYSPSLAFLFRIQLPLRIVLSSMYKPFIVSSVITTVRNSDQVTNSY